MADLRIVQKVEIRLLRRERIVVLRKRDYLITLLPDCEEKAESKK